MEKIDWSNLDQSFPYVRAMSDCIQDTVHHAEGDVWTHTKLVLARVGNDDVMRLTALYHDVCKPETRTTYYNVLEGREQVSHPNHAFKGAMAAWHDLWLQGLDLPTRLHVYWLCCWHQRIFHLWEYSYQDMIKLAHQFACLASWDDLIDFARADNAGRICANPSVADDNLVLLREWLAEYDVTPDFFKTDHDRIFYFEKANRSPHYRAQEPTGSRVILLSGLPGVGKDHYARTTFPGLPVVSLDAIRAELGVAWTDNQGTVVQTAFERARIYLRQQAPFIWNATSLTYMARDKIISLCRAYDAHISIHAFDRSLPTILRQNRDRAHVVPEPVVMALARRWEPPSRLEAHQVHWIT